MKTTLPILTGLALCLGLGGFVWNAHGRPGLDKLRAKLTRSASERDESESERDENDTPARSASEGNETDKSHLSPSATPVSEEEDSFDGDTPGMLASYAAPESAGQGRGASPDRLEIQLNSPHPTGGQLISEAASRVYHQSSISAKLRTEIKLFGQQLWGGGRYLQLGEGEDKLLRLEMSVKTDEHELSFQQVCDGRFLWLRRDFPDAVDLGRIDLKRLRSDLATSAPVHVPTRMDTWMALGGLAKLLGSLEENFHFTAARPTEVAGAKMLSLTGEWKPERLAELLSAEQTPGHESSAPNIPSHLPPHLPHRVNVLLGHDDLFPYRVDYLQRKPESAGKRGGQTNAPSWTLVTRLDLYDVKIPANIDPLEFVYKPDAAQIEDRTRGMIEALRGSSQRVK